MSVRPKNVGIIAMEMYVPKRFVAQADLEEQDGCAGKYVVGLGQKNMAFVDDREDIASIYMTAVTRLLEGYDLNPAIIGRMEVGTETLVDKSKSVKTSLMGLLGKDNTDIEGITNVNACYGGTAALFNSIAWVESSEWDGRFALVVCGDIAVYDKGPARPTGGCGAIAMLIGPDAPLILEPGVRASHMMDIYDFYKPYHSEYAAVDGKLSQWAYLNSVDTCYGRYKAKAAAKGVTNVTADHFDFFCFHSPYNKLVQKGFGRVLAMDFFATPDAKEFAQAEALQKFKDTPLEQTYESRDFELALREVSGARFKSKVLPACTINQNIGNIYTGSVFSCLVALVCGEAAALEGKRIFMFSYGSGSAASIYSFMGRKPTASDAPADLGKMASTIDMASRLESRTRATIADFNTALDVRATKYGMAPMTPDGSLDNVLPGAFYLVDINDKHHRTYARKEK